MNRSLVSVGYELHESRGKTRTSRRCIDLDSTTVEVLREWQNRRAGEDPNFDRSDQDAYVFARADGAPTRPHLLSDVYKKLVKRSGLPRIRLHDLRHTHATLLQVSDVAIEASFDMVCDRCPIREKGFSSIAAAG